MLTYKNMVLFEIYRLQVRAKALREIEYSDDTEQKLRELAAARIQAHMIVNEIKALEGFVKTL